ncbi:hypothetical protein [Nostoc sp.]
MSKNTSPQSPVPSYSFIQGCETCFIGDAFMGGVAVSSFRFGKVAAI